MNFRTIRGTILHNLFLDEQVDRFYRNFQKKHPDFTRKNRFKAVWYIMRLNYAQYKRRALTGVSVPNVASKYLTESEQVSFKYYFSNNNRYDNDKLLNELMNFDVISFDIFDTALYRKVEFPNDVFRIMASEMEYPDFVQIRKSAESEAREQKEKSEGHREVVLSEIYDILAERYGINRNWQKRECELEIDLSTANEYIFKIYKELLNVGKSVVFTSDMYLPKHVIADMLEKNGYEKYDKLYLSNEYNLRKGDGKLQKVLLTDFKEKKIVHIGDSLNGDINKSLEAGLQAIYNPDSRLSFREHDMDNLAGSFYRALINHSLNNGLWNKNLYFEHGFRVGGILVAGFCEYINDFAKKNHIEKILFSSRDCYIIYKIYNKYFKEFDNEYIHISRYAIMSVTSERYLYDWAERFIFRYGEQVGASKTVSDILKETGFSYLIDYLEDNDIDKYLFYSAINKKKMKKFIFDHVKVIQHHQKSALDAAKLYFSDVVQDRGKVLVVDIGWSGTGIVALKYFLKKNVNEHIKVFGTLMCTSRGGALTNCVSDGTISSYIYSPFSNMDITRFMMPARVSAQKADLLHMPLEFLFTSIERSLIGYKIEGNKISFEYANYESDNKYEIEQMQIGMMFFVEKYQLYRKKYKNIAPISPYVAFNPLKEAISHQNYCYEVYKNFTYDAFSTPFIERNMVSKYGELFDIQKTVVNYDIKRSDKKKILFITPELPYTGAPRSLLRMCKVAKQLGYEPVVWSSKPGPFIQEYENNNISVIIMPESHLSRKETIALLKTYNMAVCNTIVTNEYAKICGRYMPIAWYIREATNIMDFCRNNPERLYLLKNSKDVYCVSEYAAIALNKYNKYGVRVIHNSVEDEIDLALPHVNGGGEKVKFVQFGTMEYRKGYDVLIAAYETLPSKYREKAELYFAGGFINSGSPYCDYIFSKISHDENIHYLGVVKGEKNKIETLSQMDVIVVASRDESCSLVALEGAMLSKPLIVTENVGAKYIVNNKNGIIVKTGDVESLRNALIQMIDDKSNLQKMGDVSRQQYEKYASMENHISDLKKLYARNEEKERLIFKFNVIINRIKYSYKRRKIIRDIKEKTSLLQAKKKESVIVSLTSHPGRIKTVHECVQSLLVQSVSPKKILLWLSKEQFPQMEADLPRELLLLQNDIFNIKWTEDDLKPHKKYYYTMQKYRSYPIIIVDDDVKYDYRLIESLMQSYRKFPSCISCMRANLMLFRPDGTLRSYDNWQYDYKILRDVPSYQLMPTGVGGVLYPPGIFSEDIFSKKAIIQTSLYCDDLWLKFNAVKAQVRTVIPQVILTYQEIPNTQEVALWRKNVNKNNNDDCIKKILNYFNTDANNILEIIRKDRFC